MSIDVGVHQVLIGIKNLRHIPKTVIVALIIGIDKITCFLEV
jgi:hypothetical protein